MKTIQPQDENAAVFRLPYAYYNLLMPPIVWTALIVITALLFLTESAADVSMMLAVIAGMLLVDVGFVIYGWWIFTHNYLALSPHGIEYRAPGLCWYVRWGDTDRIGVYRLHVPRYSRNVVVIYLKPHAVEEIAFRNPMFPFIQSRLLKHFIPLSDFATNHWRDHEIGRLIHRYAPHL